MKNLTLTIKQAQVLWATLEQIVNDDTRESYKGNRNNREWLRSAYCSEYKVRLLREIMEKLPYENL